MKNKGNAKAKDFKFITEVERYLDQLKYKMLYGTNKAIETIKNVVESQHILFFIVRYILTGKSFLKMKSNNHVC